MLSLGSRTFRPGLVASLAAGIALAAAIALGNWQVRRAGEKLALQERLDDRSHGAPVQIPPRMLAADEIAYYRVAVRGEFLPQHTILLDNRIYKGQVGYQVLTPLRIDGGNLSVLVNRGWVAAGPRRESLPQFPTPAGPQDVEGIAMPPSRHYLQLGPEVSVGTVWENLDLDRYAAESKLTVEPFLVQQLNTGNDGLTRIQERPDTGVNMHRGYAFQWYALGVLVVVLYVTLNLKRKNGEQT